MRSEPRWREIERGKQLAGVLAEFSNLDIGACERFRDRHPNFLPPTFWNSANLYVEGKTTMGWIEERDRLRKAWEAQFPAGLTLPLVTSNAFLIDDVLSPDASKGKSQSWPYQTALLFLHVNPTKARICVSCGRRFVSETRAKCCRPLCTANYRARYRNEEDGDNKGSWWARNKDRLNAIRRRKYRAKAK
jgi:hypothetical protein